MGLRARRRQLGRRVARGLGRRAAATSAAARARAECGSRICLASDGDGPRRQTTRGPHCNSATLSARSQFCPSPEQHQEICNLRERGPLEGSARSRRIRCASERHRREPESNGLARDLFGARRAVSAPAPSAARFADVEEWDGARARGCDRQRIRLVCSVRLVTPISRPISRCVPVSVH